MNPALSPAARQLLALVRSSLWQRPAEAEAFAGAPVDWRKIGQMALQQTVGAMAFESALSLPDSLQPPKEWIRTALAFTETNRRTHLLVDGCVAEAVTRLRSEGVDAVLLKGQAYARAYPRSDMRQCGDIDLYVGESRYHEAYLSAVKLGWKCSEMFIPEAKHYGCVLRGVRVELHQQAARLSPASADRRFQEWSRAQITSSGRTVAVAGQDIPVPSVLFDIVFVFLHLNHHFVNGGIGLRHICDLTMLLHTHAKEINQSELEYRLREFKLMRAWKSIVPLTVLYLGLPEQECPFYSAKYEKRALRVLSAILKEGNFGRVKQKRSGRPEGYLAGKLYSLRRLTVSHLGKLWYDPETVLRSFFRYLYIGTVQIFKDMRKGADR